MGNLTEYMDAAMRDAEYEQLASGEGYAGTWHSQHHEQYHSTQLEVQSIRIVGSGIL